MKKNIIDWPHFSSWLDAVQRTIKTRKRATDAFKSHG